MPPAHVTLFAPDPIGDVRLVDRYHDHQAFCVNEQMPLSTTRLGLGNKWTEYLPFLV